MKWRFPLAVGFVVTMLLASSCGPCSSLCCLLLTGGDGGGQAAASPSSLRGSPLTPEAQAVAEHAIAQSRPGAQKF